MNGRLYDPENARFLNADPVIQEIYNNQAFNRYTYCYNNPLKYVDPSGYKNVDLCLYRINSDNIEKFLELIKHMGSVTSALDWMNSDEYTEIDDSWNSITGNLSFSVYDILTQSGGDGRRQLVSEIHLIGGEVPLVEKYREWGYKPGNMYRNIGAGPATPGFGLFFGASYTWISTNPIN